MNDLGIIDTFMETFSQYIDSGFGLLSGDVACSGLWAAKTISSGGF